MDREDAYVANCELIDAKDKIEQLQEKIKELEKMLESRKYTDENINAAYNDGRAVGATGKEMRCKQQ